MSISNKQKLETEKTWEWEAQRTVDYVAQLHRQ